jgi:diguanylate cyclase (GGDEF)-like protein
VQVTEKKQYQQLKLFVLTFVIIISLASIILFFFARKNAHQAFEVMKSNQHWAVQMEYNYIQRNIASLVSDVSFLQDIYGKEFHALPNDKDLAKELISFANRRQVYDEIYYVDNRGNETLKIKLNHGKAEKVPASELKNISSTHFFKDAIITVEDSLYIAPAELNKVRDNVEIPYKPMIRLGMPIFIDGKMQGVLFVNYLAKDLLASFKNYGQAFNSQILLLNQQGYYLASENPEDEWGFMFPNGANKRFDLQYPQAWSALLHEGASQALENNKLFTIMPVDLQQLFVQDARHKNIFLPKLIMTKDAWYIVSVVPQVRVNIFTAYNDAVKGIVNVDDSFVWPIVLLGTVAIALLVAFGISYFRTMHYKAEYDALTNAFSRRAGEERLQELYADALEKKHNLTLCFLDLNGLKEVNDKLGHANGDEMLVTIVRAIMQEIRHSDFVVRMGGDEFLVVLPEANVEQGEIVWKRIQKRLSVINVTGQRPYLLSASHGLVDIISSPRLILGKISRPCG